MVKKLKKHKVEIKEKVKKRSHVEAQLVKPSKFHFQIAVSGSAAGETVEDEQNLLLAEKIGEEIARHKMILVTGATTGLPYASAIGCKRAGGMSIGISPATSHYEHVTRYKLPDDVFDAIIYTGFGYSGRNIFIIRSADAVIEIGGRIGTLNEFTIAFEEKIPIGVLIGTGGISDDIKHILRVAGKEKASASVVYESDPALLVSEIEERLTGKVSKHSGTKITPSKTTEMIIKKIRRISTRPEIG